MYIIGFPVRFLNIKNQNQIEPFSLFFLQFSMVFLSRFFFQLRFGFGAVSFRFAFLKSMTNSICVDVALSKPRYMFRSPNSYSPAPNVAKCDQISVDL